MSAHRQLNPLAEEIKRAEEWAEALENDCRKSDADSYNARVFVCICGVAIALLVLIVIVVMG